MKMLVGPLQLIVLVTGALAFEAPEHWQKVSRSDIKKAWNIKQNYNLAKNTILMVGDGLGLSTITAARIFLGQKHNQTGEEYKLSFEDFPHVGLSKTYNLDRQVADSAASAVAMMSGVKVNMGTVGVTGDVPFAKNCSEYREDRTFQSILDFALADGKSVGIVTTTRITHATPAAAYAHTPWRDWEKDSYMAGIEGCEKVKDIAYQLVVDNPNITVLLGGGARGFKNRDDGKDLVQEWKNHKSTNGWSHSYVNNRQDLLAVDPTTTDYLFGMFTESHMSYEVERPDTEPSLTDMTHKALQILKKNPRGYFLLIEGGRIDHAHHDNYGKIALEETIVFDKTVEKVREMTSSEDTLLVVTADHSHVFTISGYPTRGNNILGLVDKIEPGEEAADNKPYLTLGYTNGPADFTRDFPGDTTGNDFQQPGCVIMPYETHGGEDVSIYAMGPMSHLFHTTHEQTHVAHVMMYAACLGPYTQDCDLERRETMARQGQVCDGASNMTPWLALLMTCCVTLLSAFWF